MRLYLVRHADAKKEEEDSARSLSEKGLRDIQLVARHFGRPNLKVSSVIHSPKLRAKQTAGILAEKLRPFRGVSGADGLSPMDDPGIWAEKVRQMEHDIALVGHLPHLERLASLLLCGDAGKNVVAFTTACVVCLERDSQGVWSVIWMITPEVLALLCGSGPDEGPAVYAGDLGL